MPNQYHIDPTSYSLAKLKADLSSRKLIPSRQPLRDNLEERFEILEKMGITTLDDLISAIKNKAKIEEFSSRTGIDFEYLNLLRREVNSYFPNPVPLNKFSGISPDHLASLSARGIKNSRHLFEYWVEKKNIQKLAEETCIPLDPLRELIGLSDLVRAYGVGPAFAKILYDTGIHSIRDLLNYSPAQVVELYERQTGRTADFTESDIQFSLEIIKALALE
jgi:hypothetical protein